MAENSYAQLIDDFDKGINVLKGETLTEYIKRMGGVDYESKADGGAIGIEVLFGPKRKDFASGGWHPGAGRDKKGYQTTSPHYSGGGDGPPSITNPYVPPVVKKTPVPTSDNDKFEQNLVTGKWMTNADLATKQKFLNYLNKNKSFNLGQDVDADTLYANYLEATGLDKHNKNVLVDSETINQRKEVDGNTIFDTWTTDNTFKDLDKDWTTRSTTVEDTAGNTTTNRLTPTGMWENDVYLGNRAPQSMAIDPPKSFDLPDNTLFAEVTDKQKDIIGKDINKLNQGLIDTKTAYDNAKMFDNKGSTGFWGMGAEDPNPMTPQEFNQELIDQGYKGKEFISEETMTGKDGGRVGLENGGTSNWWDGLEGEAKGIYDSMTAYGASDAEIQAKLQAQNLWSPDGTPDSGNTGQVTGIINQNIGDDRPYAGQVVDQTDYSFNKKNYGPGKKLEVNPEAIGMSFYDSEPGSGKQTLAASKGINMNAFNQGDFNQKKEMVEKAGLDFNTSTLEKLNQPVEAGFMESFMSAAVPSKQFSQFTSPGTGGVLTGPAEEGFMSQEIEGLPGLTREDLRSQYDNYSNFWGRPSNYLNARVKGTAGNLLGMAVSGMSGIPFVGTGITKLGDFFGPQGDKSLQSKYTVDNAGYGNTGARDEFGVATFDAKDGFLGLKGNTTRDYVDRMSDQMDKNIDFFGGKRTGLTGKTLDKTGSSVENFSERWSNFDDLDAAAQQALINEMKAINGFKTKQMLAYKNRLATEKINSDFAKKQAEIEAAKKAAESRAESARQYDPNVHGPTNYGLGSDGQQSYDTRLGFGSNATTGGPVSNKTGRGRTDYSKGGLASMFTRRR